MDRVFCSAFWGDSGIARENEGRFFLYYSLTVQTSNGTIGFLQGSFLTMARVFATNVFFCVVVLLMKVSNFFNFNRVLPEKFT